MPVTIEELADRRRASAQSATLEYRILDSIDTDDARAGLLTNAPATFNAGGGTTLYLDSPNCEVYENDQAVFGVAKYKPLGGAELAEDETAFSFDTTGGTQHLIASIATANSYPKAGTTAPTTNKLIGITKDGVEGVDVTVPVFSYQVTKCFDVADVTQSYLRTLHDRTGTVNSAQFTVTTDDGITIVTEAGENLFLGASGGIRNGKATITYFFAASRNQTGMSIGGISSIAKKGWEYLWVLWEDVVSQNSLVKQARAVYVEQVYLTASHASLNL